MYFKTLVEQSHRFFYFVPNILYDSTIVKACIAYEILLYYWCEVRTKANYVKYLVFE